jgi:hypothetical protein
MIIIIIGPAADGGIFAVLLLGYILYSITSSVFTYVSAFAVCVVLIAVILRHCANIT